MIEYAQGLLVILALLTTYVVRLRVRVMAPTEGGGIDREETELSAV